MPDPATTPAAVASPAPTASSAPQSQPDTRATEVIDAYLEYWDVFLTANDPPDETYPALRRVATGAAYEALFDAAQANRLGGRVLRLPQDSVSRHDAEVVSITDDRATVHDCNVDDGLAIDADSGEVLDNDVVTRLGTATLVREDGRWKVSRTRVRKTWEGVAGCVAS